MHLKTLKIKNFRALEDITIDFATRVSVIVGPNAAGKTTVIEAICLVKALLAPRTQGEAAQILHSLGASSPHIPQSLRIEAIARDVSKPLTIRCHFELSLEEISDLKAAREQIATSLIQSQGGQGFATPDTLIAYLSSDDGKRNLHAAESSVGLLLDEIESTRRCTLEITFPPGSAPRSDSNPIEAQFVTYLERRLPPHQTGFTYFPADRALPSGEQPVQLGGPDASQQLESYNSQPQLKFNRLKNAIFSASLFSSPTDGRSLAEEFERIFNGILKGRKLEAFGINEIGFLNVQIRDLETDQIFDLDGMSSGEKGLILTFLLIARSVVRNGIILLDEPELHLNPAVCKDLLTFIIDEYAKPRNLQILICSHSPEILAGAFDNDECALYHLISSTNISRVHTQDIFNVNETLKRLGASESDNLLYRGVIFVEGPDDVSLLEIGYSHILRRFKLKSSMGRSVVEKAAERLQENEDNSAAPISYFILDLDDEETTIKNSKSVRVLQWDRRCLENYLIDIQVIAKLLMDGEIVKSPLNNEGEVNALLTKLAMSQLRDVALRKVYGRYKFGGIGIRKDDLKHNVTADVASVLLGRIQDLRSQIEQIDSTTWPAEFEQEVETERAILERVWEPNWQKLCDGKRLIHDLWKSAKVNMNEKKFKVRLMKEMAVTRSSNWLYVETQIQNLIKSQP
jgi:predicted ATPase